MPTRWLVHLGCAALVVIATSAVVEAIHFGPEFEYLNGTQLRETGDCSSVPRPDGLSFPYRCEVYWDALAGIWYVVARDAAGRVIEVLRRPSGRTTLKRIYQTGWPQTGPINP